jgi:hypothetical protein
VKTGTRTADALLASAVAVFAATGITALLDAAASGHLAAGFATASILAVLGLAANVRQIACRSVRTVTVAIAKVPVPDRGYWRGYGDASADALGGDDGDTTDLRNP